MVMRYLRWEPKNYWQVWLTAAISGVTCFIIWSVRDELSIGVAVGVIMTLVLGAAGSYRLDRRTDANTVAEWSSTRRLTPTALTGSSTREEDGPDRL